MTRAVLSAALALCGAPDLAEPMVTDRPDFTESSSAVPTGRIQLEVGGTHVELEEASESSLGANLGVARPTGGEGRFTSAWGVTEDFQLDARAARRLTGEGPDLLVGLGLAARF